LADEYDGAARRGEAVGAHDGAKKRVPNGNAIATAADVGLTRKQIHNARVVRDAVSSVNRFAQPLHRKFDIRRL
jgi:hypothetical protein